MQIFIGTAVFVAGARPDVAKRAYPTYPFNDRAGWGFLILTNMLPNQGNGMFRIYAVCGRRRRRRATLLGARRPSSVNNATATLPFGAIDTPGQGETIAGQRYLNWGWALTPQPKIIPTDGSTIQVYRGRRADGAARSTTCSGRTSSGLVPGAGELGRAGGLSGARHDGPR